MELPISARHRQSVRAFCIYFPMEAKLCIGMILLSTSLCISQSRLPITRCLKFNDCVAPPLSTHIPLALQKVSTANRIMLSSPHICSIRQIPNQCREGNHICKCDPRSSARPSEVFVTIDKHVCVPLAYRASISSLVRMCILLYLTNAGSKAMAKIVCQRVVLHELVVVRLTVIVMARHVGLCWRSP
jgi:hypothetical protein